MNARIPTPTTPVSTDRPRAARRRPALRFLHHYDDPPGTDSYALPSEVALRPIEPHYAMRR